MSGSQTMLTGFFKDARFGPFSNLHTCISLMRVYWFGQCWGWRFSPIATFFSLVISRAFRDAPHSPFRCGDPNQCLPTFWPSPRSTHVYFTCGNLSIWTVLKVAETGLRAAWFWPTLGRFPGFWAIFKSSRDSKLIREDFAFQWNGERENFWTLGYEQSGRDMAPL